VPFVGLRRGMPVHEVRAPTFCAHSVDRRADPGQSIVQRLGLDNASQPKPDAALDSAARAVILVLALMWPFAAEIFFGSGLSIPMIWL
jgi:hypothetical protein